MGADEEPATAGSAEEVFQAEQTASAEVLHQEKVWPSSRNLQCNWRVENKSVV
jgi:hypothetical protein